MCNSDVSNLKVHSLMITKETNKYGSLINLYDVYACLRNSLNTCHHSTIIFKNEIVQVTALVMMLEDGDATLAARFEAERCPHPVPQPIANTKKAIKYDRKNIAEKAHYYAKASSIGTYRKRLSAGFKLAWLDAKSAKGFAVHTSNMPLLEIAPKPVKIPAPISYPSIFDYDILYYNPAHYVLYTEPKYFNSTRNHSLRY